MNIKKAGIHSLGAVAFLLAVGVPALVVGNRSHSEDPTSVSSPKTQKNTSSTLSHEELHSPDGDVTHRAVDTSLPENIDKVAGSFDSLELLLGPLSDRLSSILSEVDWKKIGEMEWQRYLAKKEGKPLDTNRNGEGLIVASQLIQALGKIQKEFNLPDQGEAVNLFRLMMLPSFLEAGGVPAGDAGKLARMGELYREHVGVDAFQEAGVENPDRLHLERMLERQEGMRQVQKEINLLFPAENYDLLAGSSLFNRDQRWGAKKVKSPEHLARKWMRAFRLDDASEVQVEQVAREYFQNTSGNQVYQEEDKGSRNSRQVRAQVKALEAILDRVPVTEEQRDRILKSRRVYFHNNDA